MGAVCAAGAEDGQEEAAEVDPAKGGESSGVGRCGAAAVARSASLSWYSELHFSWVMACVTFTDSGEAGKQDAAAAAGAHEISVKLGCITPCCRPQSQ